MNAQGFDLLLRQKTCFFPYIRVSPQCICGNFYVRCEVIAGYPSGDSKGNVNDIHNQVFYHLHEYPFEAKVVTPYIRPHVHPFGHFMCNEST